MTSPITVGAGRKSRNRRCQRQNDHEGYCKYLLKDYHTFCMGLSYPF